MRSSRRRAWPWREVRTPPGRCVQLGGSGGYTLVYRRVHLGVPVPRGDEGPRLPPWASTLGSRGSPSLGASRGTASRAPHSSTANVRLRARSRSRASAPARRRWRRCRGATPRIVTRRSRTSRWNLRHNDRTDRSSSDASLATDRACVDRSASDAARRQARRATLASAAPACGGARSPKRLLQRGAQEVRRGKRTGEVTERRSYEAPRTADGRQPRSAALVVARLAGGQGRGRSWLGLIGDGETRVSLPEYPRESSHGQRAGECENCCVDDEPVRSPQRWRCGGGEASEGHTASTF